MSLIFLDDPSIPTNVSRDTAHRAPYRYERRRIFGMGGGQTPRFEDNGWVVLDARERVWTSYWSGNTEGEVAAAVDRLNTECARFIMTEGTQAEGL